MAEVAATRRAQILRSEQKDDAFVDRLSKEMPELLLSGTGPKTWMQWQELVEPTARFIYLMATTFSNYQTLGEEYAGLLQVDYSLKRLPSKAARLCSILGQTYLPWAVQLAAGKLHARGKTKLSAALIVAATLLAQFNTCLFFYHGSFYNLSQRLTGVHHLNLANHPNDSSTLGLQRMFRILGLVHCVKFIVQAWSDLQELMVNETYDSCSDKTDVVAATSGKKCPLCLDVRTNSSCTPCGHVFCWGCIIESVLVKPECPVCREDIPHPSRIVFMHNYN